MPRIAVQPPLDPETAALRLADQPGLAWLDGDGNGDQGRYSFVTCQPSDTRRVPWGSEALASLGHDHGPLAAGTSQADLHAELPSRGGEHGPAPDRVPHWIGAVAYEALFFSGDKPPQTQRAASGPLAQFARYDAVYAFDHRLRRGWVIGTAPQSRWLHGRLTRASTTVVHGQVTNLSPPSARRHRWMMEQTLRHITRGDIYQANLAHAWHGQYAGDPLWLARQMRRASPVPFGAYLDFGDQQLVCRSMESFLDFRRADRRLWTRPIKGTVARLGTHDGGEAAALRANPKERAEHTMIVDLLRNDLGRVAEVGSVVVEEPFTVEPYRGLSHLVSTVACTVRPQEGLDRIISATFPPGSVTGAPKRRATEVIESLEAQPRGFYCGALGFIDRAGGMKLAVAIRTAQLQDNQVRYHAGGGIVSASDPERELAETVLKARVFLDAVGHGTDLSP